MGSQIAAHLANAGVPVLLLDVTPQAAREGLDKARALKPDPFFTPDTHSLISTGGFDDGLARASQSDWIVEAIVERLDVKRQLFERLEPHRRADAIISTNTSGIPIAAIAEGRSDGFRRRFLGTHFFNPPRYLRLLEIIPTADTDAAVVETISTFADRRLGKGVVVAKDTPNFIANHIGLFGVARVFEALNDGFTIEEIDAITGPALGRPKSATFRTMDLAGVDVLGHVARNLAGAGRSDALPEPEAFQLPAFVDGMIKRGWIGDKAGQGFYKKVRNPESRMPNAEGRRPKPPDSAFRPVSFSGLSGSFVSTVFRADEKSLVDHAVEQPRAHVDVETPQPRALLRRQPKPRQIEKVRARLPQRMVPLAQAPQMIPNHPRFDADRGSLLV
jgi:3-hydroxyacyl-CoA dehydrogenase